MKLASNPKFLEKSRNYIHLLQKKVVCGHCGNLMTGHIGSDNINGYYLCSSHFGSMIKCGNTTLNYEKFETIVWHFIKYHSDIFMELNEEEKATKIAKLEEKKKESQAAITLKGRLIQQEQQKVKSLLELVKSSGGAFSMLDIVNDKNEIDKTVANYEQQIIKHNSEIKLIDNRINQIRNVEFSKETIASIEADRTQMKKVINEVIDHITVYKVNNNAVVMQLEMYNNSTIYNILLNQRSKRIFKYWYIEEHVASFLMGKYRASTLKECDNFYFYNPETLSHDGFPYWGYYLFDEMCAILEIGRASCRERV